MTAPTAPSKAAEQFSSPSGRVHAYVSPDRGRGRTDGSEDAEYRGCNQHGRGGSGGPGANSWPELGMYGITSAFTLAYYAVSGNGASGQNGANTPGLAPSFNASAPIPYGFPNAGGAGEYGGGGGGGGVNANGNPGANGILIIWWGD